MEPNRPVTTAGIFISKHPLKGKEAERILARRKPESKPERSVCLMVFEDENCARRHWAKMSGGKLYEVQIVKADILHRGDMRLVDEIGESLTYEAVAEKIADRYWAGEITDKPIVELLLREAIIARLISDDHAERRAEFKRCFGIKGMDPQDTGENDEEFLRNLQVPRTTED